eukprot:CAMPEP_0197634870 /NCGR_PEP_ID=MMETSP1338-20131121/10844_1 /TAXON_ID=43686 ORGANISM="Pelagodinium beii, Strain RCC1491" /NCGR_SAMPLE_ID=MMETSP1338 /ASSEMBLY_ACC=CAM_ASM_000754 /LENGTH=516 /DNA_ID=CAMNT_0043206819 /DNA_START=208 /DNA_END=1759 /DNA_ORIENTATION=+
MSWLAAAEVIDIDDRPVSSTSQEPYLVQLQRLSTLGSAESGSDPLIAPPDQKREAFAFVGKIFLGSPRPQLLQVTFDTSSGQVVVPSWQCQSQSCEAHRKFATRASKSCTRNLYDENFFISSISLDCGAGNVTGELVHEGKVCFSAARSGRCLDMGLLAATEMTDEPYLLDPGDGSVGLSLPALASSPEFHLLSRLEAHHFETSFALFLGQSEGEIALGGFNPRRASREAFSWAAVLQPSEGFWQLRIQSLRLGNATITCPGGCRGIVDSSTSTIGVPDAMAPKLTAALGQVCQGRPALELVVEGYNASSPIILRLEPEDYSRGCWPAILATKLPEEFSDVIVLGQPLLQKYYTIFDWGASRIGFTLAANTSEPADLLLVATDEELAADLELLPASEADSIERNILAAERLQAAKQRREDRFQAVSFWFFHGMLLQVIISMLFLISRSLRPGSLRQLFLHYSGGACNAEQLLAATSVVDANDVAGLECSICLTVDGEEALGGVACRAAMPSTQAAS